MGQWLEHTVSTNINAPIAVVWHFWSDLDSMPKWMTWIESVKTVDEETSKLPDLTEWTLAANGFRFKWQAQITERIEAQKLKWKDVIDSKNYNYVEMSHHIILVSIVDIFAQKNL